MIKIIITGRTSFIGKYLVKDLAANTDWLIYSLERMTARNSHLACVISLYHDLRAEVPQYIVDRVADADCLIHLAADVSGIKSLQDPELSVKTNVVGTFNVLELARRIKIKRFVYVSTGEVVGAMPFPFFADEKAPLRPSNPYAASKAAAEALVNAYRVSFGVPALIVRSMNVFGVGQSLDRFVPMVVNRLLHGATVTCHVDKHGNPGSRCWLHVDKLVGALRRSLDPKHSYRVGETYHVVGPERHNQWIIGVLASALGVNFEIEPVIAGPSHDLRYALQDTKLGYNFNDDLERTLAETAISLRTV
jgi:dTDP-glucose 4,6-dehydratase